MWNLLPLLFLLLLRIRISLVLQTWPSCALVVKSIFFLFPLHCPLCHVLFVSLESTIVLSFFLVLIADLLLLSLYTDVWDPSPVSSCLEFHYFIIFIDDCSRVTWIYFLWNRSYIFSMFKDLYGNKDSILYVNNSSHW